MLIVRPIGYIQWQSLSHCNCLGCQLGVKVCVSAWTLSLAAAYIAPHLASAKHAK
jgi:hypothetical protein